MLITVEELEAFMGREFTEAEEAQSTALIQVVSDLIESVTGVSFTLVIDDEITSQADGYGMIELNARPVQSVTVYDIDTDEELSYYQWDGMQTIYGLFPNAVYGITYTHGYETVPGDIKAVAYGACSRVLYNPSGLRQETVGAISVTYPGVGGEAGTVNLSRLENKVLDKYKKNAQSWRMAAQRRRVSTLPILTVDNDVD